MFILDDECFIQNYHLAWRVKLNKLKNIVFINLDNIQYLYNNYNKNLWYYIISYPYSLKTQFQSINIILFDFKG